jgi:hypothetical protein
MLVGPGGLQISNDLGHVSCMTVRLHLDGLNIKSGTVLCHSRQVAAKAETAPASVATLNIRM